MAERTQHCNDGNLHGPHGFEVRGRRGRAEQRWCPGMGRCQVCGKHAWGDKLVPVTPGSTAAYRHRGC